MAHGMTRRGFAALGAFVGSSLLLGRTPRVARAFGDEGAFNPRPLLTGSAKWEGPRASAPARWSRELANRTSAPSHLTPMPVHADDDALLAEPFVYLVGEGSLAPLTLAEIAHLRRFFAQGGVLLVDDSAPESGGFGRDVRREMARVLPDDAPVGLGDDHVIFKSFYLLTQARSASPQKPRLSAIVRGGAAQVIFTTQDLAGALSQSDPLQADPSALGLRSSSREQAIRLAVNIAMYVLCSNYKDDQVHAPFLMRRRAAQAL